MTDYAQMTDEELLNAPPPEDEEFSQDSADEGASANPVEAAQPVKPEAVQDPAGFADEQNVPAQQAPLSSQEAGYQTDQAAVDYAAFYNEITKPFRANGKELRVTNPADVISLMQQGANYAKKMAAIKPIQRIGKLLEENQLLDEGSVNFLIDLHNKKPEAIAKLIQDSGIDLYELDVSKGEEYTPTPRHVSDSSIELQTVLDELRETSPTFDKTIQTISAEWDEQSRATLVQHPELIRLLDAQVQDGTYEKITRIMEYEKIMGRLTGVSTLQAYKAIGERLFASPAGQASVNGTAVAAQNAVQSQAQHQAQQRAQEQAARDAQRRAAAAPRKTADTARQAFNPLTISDEELMKLDLSSFAI